MGVRIARGLKAAAVFGLFAGFALSQAYGQGLSVRIVDEAGKPLPGVLVEVLGTPSAAETDGQGQATVATGGPTRLRREFDAPGGFTLQAGILRFNLSRASAFSAEVLDASGATLGSLPPALLLPGPQTIRLPATGRSTGSYWVDMRLGGRRLTLRSMRAGSEDILVESSGPSGAGRAAAKASAKTAAGDSLRFSKDGFLTQVAPSPGPGQAIEVKMRKGLDFTHQFTGTGLIKDIATGRTVELPMDKRIHILLLPEGFNQEHFDINMFKRAGDRWMNEVFRLDPLNAFKQAFVVWRYPVVSNGHIPVQGAGDTYFRTRLEGRSLSEDQAEASMRAWDIVEKNPRLPRRVFPSPGGGYPLHANGLSNLLVVVLFQDAGIGGRAQNWVNPRNRSEWMGAALGAPEPHELMHTLAHIFDEYNSSILPTMGAWALEENTGGRTNISPVKDCSQVPWKYLLSRGTINPSTFQLVGAFGANGRYHSEFRCLMNGIGENHLLYGPGANLGEPARLCNLCREILLMRVYERTGVLPDLRVSLDTWAKSYREPFFREFGFKVPSVLPQENGAGKAFFEECSPATAKTGVAGPAPAPGVTKVPTGPMRDLCGGA